MAEIHVNGFLFSDEKAGDTAQKEKAACDYLRRAIDWKDPESVLELYTKMIRERMFHTPVGYAFLKETQNALIDSKRLERSRIPDIPAELFDEDTSGKKDGDSGKKGGKSTDVSSEDELLRRKITEKRLKASQKKLKQTEGKLRSRMVVIALLLLVIAAMFGISLTGSSPTIINYRTRVRNEYSEWQEQLEKREDRIRKREQELGLSTEDASGKASDENSGDSGND